MKRVCNGLIDTGLVLVECREQPEEEQCLCRKCLCAGGFQPVHGRSVRKRAAAGFDGATRHEVEGTK